MMVFLAVLTIWAVLESTLPPFCLYKMQHNETTVAVLMGLAVSAVMSVSVMTATPLNSTPLFRHPDFYRWQFPSVLGVWLLKTSLRPDMYKLLEHVMRPSCLSDQKTLSALTEASLCRSPL